MSARAGSLALAWRVVSLATVVAASVGGRPLSAQDVLRGRVSGPDGMPVESAIVVATAIAGHVSRTTRTDRSGRYTVVFSDEEGDYFVAITAIGFVPRRFEVKRMADEDILIGDATLARAAVSVDAIDVRAPRARPGRDVVTADIGGTERQTNVAALLVDQVGDLAAMATSLGGVQLIPSADGSPSGFSVIGLAPDQNAMTLNGLTLGASAIPRDAAAVSSLAVSPYDVSRGGFSGGQVSVRSSPGSNFITRAFSGTLHTPQMQWSDPGGQRFALAYRDATIGGLLAGPISQNRVFYTLSYQVDWRSREIHSLLNADALRLAKAGIAGDSVVRLLAIADGLHVPISLDNRSATQLGRQALVFGSVDVTAPAQTSGNAYNLTYSASWNQHSPASTLLTEAPSHNGELTYWNALVQGRHSNYFGVGILSESSFGVSGSGSYSTPFLALPGASVQVVSTLPDGTMDVQALEFGGGPLRNSQSMLSLSGRSQVSWFSENSRHRIKLISELRQDAAEQTTSSNELGTFSFNSLADVAAGRPSFYARTMSAQRRSEQQLIGAFALGDSYRLAKDIQIQYGVRFDGNQFLARPQRNLEVERAVALRNDVVPGGVYASPRIGFAWTTGTAGQVGAFARAVRSPRAVIRGGVGLFQGIPATTSIGSALDNTGLPSGVRQITCAGLAAPSPDWFAYHGNSAAIPNQCADGSAGTVFANTVPNVNVFDPAFRAPRSLRTSLQWTGLILGSRLSAMVEGTYSLNLAQPGFADVNLRNSARFNLLNEGGRSVFVDPASIVPATGAMAWRDSRVSPLFSHVTELRSDLRSTSRQLSIRLQPYGVNTSFSWSASYVLSSLRDQTRGFGSTDSDPFAIDWGRSSRDLRHQVQYLVQYNPGDVVRLRWAGTLASGVPYTPVVIGDVNGDGYANDRAFVFDPARTADRSLAASMRALIAGGSFSARDCLTKQLGQVAARNSCQGPWASTANITLELNSAKVGLSPRTVYSLQLSNPLGAVDYLVHGEEGLRGWGQPQIPSASLLRVRGFDAQTQQFLYDVNPRFGMTSPLPVVLRQPVRLTAVVRMDLGPSLERQALIQQLNAGRRTIGSRMSATSLRMSFAAMNIPAPTAAILLVADSIGLSSVQADSISALHRWCALQLDSIWTPVARDLASLTAQYDEGATFAVYRVARESSLDLLMRVVPRVLELLTSEQYRRLPASVQSALDVRYLASIRSGTSGQGVGGMWP